MQLKNQRIKTKRNKSVTIIAKILRSKDITFPMHAT